MGASGAVFGIVGYLTMLVPTAKILLLFFIPMQLKTGAALLAGFDVVCAYLNLLASCLQIGLTGLWYRVIPGFALDHAAHLVCIF